MRHQPSPATTVSRWIWLHQLMCVWNKSLLHRCLGEASRCVMGVSWGAAQVNHEMNFWAFYRCSMNSHGNCGIQELINLKRGNHFWNILDHHEITQEVTSAIVSNVCHCVKPLIKGLLEHNALHAWEENGPVTTVLCFNHKKILQILSPDSVKNSNLTIQVPTGQSQAGCYSLGFYVWPIKLK